MSRQNLDTDPQSLKVSGILQAAIKNQGTAESPANVQILAYYDNDRNNAYDSAVDAALGNASLTAPLPVNGGETVAIPIDGGVAFRDAPVKVWADSLRNVVESDEDNNQMSTSSSCHGQPLPIGTLDPVLKWHWSGSSYQPAYNQVMSTPVVAQLNDDNNDGLVNQGDFPDIIFQAFSGSNYTGKGLLRAISGKDGKEIWTAPATPRWVSAFSGPAVGDIDHDGLVEIVISGPNQAGLMVFENNGDLKWSKSFGGGAQPALADLNQDGQVEIIHGPSVFDTNGNFLWNATQGTYDPIPLIADLDSDGYLDVFAGGTAYNHDGTLKWKSGLGHFGSAVGNFDADSDPEIVVKAVNSGIYLLEHTGAVKWGPVAVPGGGGGPITVADFDGDGQPEIGTAGASNYVVLETDGSIKWLSPTQDISSKATGSSVFDFEGDGKAEVLYGDELSFRIFDGKTGKVLFKTQNPSATLYEYPVIADIDNDEHAEIIIVSNNFNRSGSTGIRVFENRNDNWMPTRAIWNQHAYHIDNVNDDGTIPQHESASWLSHNTYRLNAFANRNALDQTDLTASRPMLIDRGYGQKPGLSIRIGNAGLAALDRSITVAFHQGSPGAGGVLLGKLSIDALASGDYKDLTLDNIVLTNRNDLYAVADSDLRVTECDEGNNQVSIPLTDALALGKIQVALDTSEYSPNSPVQLSANIDNTGALQANYHVELKIEDSDGNPVIEFSPVATTDLPGGASTSIHQDWNTGIILSGGYRLHGLLYDAAGNPVHEHSVPFSIANGETPALDVRVFTDKPVYQAFDQIRLTSRMINTSQNTILPPTVVDVSIPGPDGNILFSSSVNLDELLPAALRDLPFSYNMSDAPAGDYQVQLQVKDAAGQRLMIRRHTAFKVEKNLIQALSGSVTAVPAQVKQGAPALCTETIHYISSTPADAVNLTSQLISMDTGAILDETMRTVPIGSGQTLTDIRSITTGNLSAGAYGCILNGEIAGISRRLGFAGFEVQKPPVRIDAKLQTGDHGRVLILLDKEPDITSMQPLSLVDEPSGLTHRPDLSAQRHTLETMLTQAGWSYTIATDAANFAQQLHTGGYVSYLVLSSQLKLDEPLQKELREAVFRGEGLIEAGGHDQRQGRIDEILGIKFLGKHAGMGGLTILNTDMHSPAIALFGLAGKTLKAQSLGADILGRFSNTDEPAVTSHQYGEGRADYFGFTLLAEASIPGADPLYGELILSALDHIHPATLKPYAGSVYALQMLLTNQGVATPGQAVIILPAGVSVIDKGSGTVVNDTLVWPFELIAAQTQVFDSWISLPSTPVQINALIQTGVSPDFKDHAAAMLEITPLQTPEIERILIDVQALDPGAYRQVLKYLEWAVRNQNNSDYGNALDALIHASDALIDINTPESAAIRTQVAEAIRTISQKL